MAVTPADVATTLGRSAPADESTDAKQWEMWIADVLVLVQAHYGSRFSELDNPTLDLVVREVVAERVRRPDSASSYTVAVDDGTVTRRYENGDSNGFQGILERWWSLLDPASDRQAAGAFTVRPAPSRQGPCW